MRHLMALCTTASSRSTTSLAAAFGNRPGAMPRIVRLRRRSLTRLPCRRTAIIRNRTHLLSCHTMPEHALRCLGSNHPTTSQDSDCRRQSGRWLTGRLLSRCGTRIPGCCRWRSVLSSGRAACRQRRNLHRRRHRVRAQPSGRASCRRHKDLPGVRSYGLAASCRQSIMRFRRSYLGVSSWINRGGWASRSGLLLAFVPRRR